MKIITPVACSENQEADKINQTVIVGIAEQL